MTIKDLIEYLQRLSPELQKKKVVCYAKNGLILDPALRWEQTEEAKGEMLDPFNPDPKKIERFVIVGD